MIQRVTSMTAAAVLALGVLTGCTFSASLTYTVPASTLATQAEDVLEGVVGARPVVDCGTEPVELIEGQHLDCVLTDPATGLKYEATVDLTEVEGTDYKISVQGGDLIE